MNPAGSADKCRYLSYHDDDGFYCAYWDLPLRVAEALKCYPSGWDCYEEDNEGIIFDDRDGQWKSLVEFLEDDPTGPPA